MLTFTQRLPADPYVTVDFTLSLTAEERTRSRHCFQTTDGQSFYLQLPRGTVLQDGDLLQADGDASLLRIMAKAEPVLRVKAVTPLALLRAAYHLGNRHVPLEVRESWLCLSPDPVLRSMLEQLGLEVQEATLPFHPEGGAYGHYH